MPRRSTHRGRRRSAACRERDCHARAVLHGVSRARFPEDANCTRLARSRRAAPSCSAGAHGCHRLGANYCARQRGSLCGRWIAGRRRCGFGCQPRFSRCGSCAHCERTSLCPNPFELRWVTNLIVCRWWLWLEWFIPPPVGALARGSGAGRDRGWGSGRWAGQRSWTQRSAGAVGDGEVVWGSGDGDDASMVQPVVIGA